MHPAYEEYEVSAGIKCGKAPQVYFRIDWNG